MTLKTPFETLDGNQLVHTDKTYSQYTFTRIIHLQNTCTVHPQTNLHADVLDVEDALLDVEALDGNQLVLHGGHCGLELQEVSHDEVGLGGGSGAGSPGVPLHPEGACPEPGGCPDPPACP